MSGEDLASGPIQSRRPQPTYTPPPPADLSELKGFVKKELDDKTNTFKELPTPAAFATIENDVKHLWNYFKGLAAAGLVIIIAAVSVYLSVDTKISKFDQRIDIHSKDAESRYRTFERGFLEDIRGVNSRVDNMIIINGINNTHNKSIESSNMGTGSRASALPSR